jgi:tetratricopeptide (TPR) repeat protein/tRNA A-37 threonylcarbamoyl transferase component Bud32
MLGRLLGGRYQIVHHLGGGGFGQTYLAEDLHLPGQPSCVVKQLKPRMTNPEALQTARRLFDTEAQVLYSLGSHDQIPRLFAHFEEGQDFFLVQELIEGEVLSQELKPGQPLPEAEVIHLIWDILTVLEFVHLQQVIHRDIKPSNLIRRRGDRRIILIDFGAVKQIGVEAYESPEQASVTIAVGSSAYMPNEQLAGKPQFSSDIYAVGMLAIQCLTGISPKRLKLDPRTSEILWRDQAKVSAGFANILDKMVRYDYRQRHPSAREALEALSPLAQTTPLNLLLSQTRLVSLDGHLVWLERGDELFQLQRYAEAIAAYDRVIQATPDDYVAWFKRGIALEHINRYEEAAGAYDQVIQLQPQDYLAWFKWGGVLEKLQRYPESLQSYEKVVTLQPDNYWAWHDRGRVLEALKRHDEAIAAYDRAVQLKPDFQLAIDSRKRVLSQLSRVDTLYHLQHYDEAVASCDKAIQDNPSDPIPWLMRGMALENLNSFEQAVLAYERVVELQPDDHVAWFKRANLLEKLQRFDEAIASYYRVVQLQPENYWAWHDRGRLLEHLKRYEEAIAAYDRAVQIKPDFQAAVEGRSRILHQMQQARSTFAEEDETIVYSCPVEEVASELPTYPLEEGLGEHPQPPQKWGAMGTIATTDETVVVLQSPVDTLQMPDQSAKAIPVCPTSPQLQEDEETSITDYIPVPALEEFQQWVEEGQTLEKQKRYEDALLAYERACHIQANSSIVWCRLGNLLYKLERYEAAATAYEKMVQLNSEDADSWCPLGWCQVRLKRYDRAIAAFAEAVRLKPTSYTAWYGQGVTFCCLKRYPDALLCFEKVLELKPDYHPAWRDRQRLQHLLTALSLKAREAESGIQESRLN